MRSDRPGRAPLDAVLAREFPRREIDAVHPARRGNSKRTVFVTFTDAERVVVYLSPDVRALHTETCLAEAIAARTAVPTPSVLAVGTVDGDGKPAGDGRPAGEVGYAVVERASGVDLHERFSSLDGDAQRRVASTFGRVLGELHETFTFEAYGDVSVDTAPGEVRPPGAGTDPARFVATGPSDWVQWFEAYVEAGVEALPAPLSRFGPRIRASVDRADLADDPPSRLFPWDLRPGNALVDADPPNARSDGESVDTASLSAVLDWGSPLAADPGLAVAKAEHLVADWYVDDGEPLRAAFRTGYERRAVYPTVPPAYRVAAVVRSAVDSRGVVTRPGYPERTGDDAVTFHADRLEAALDGT